MPKFKSNINYCNKFSGFTLAEVLITLVVIGVIAALTISTLMKNTQDAEFKTAYKKAFSVISQALLSANNDNALLSSPGNYSAETMTNFQTIMSYLKT